MVRVVDGRRPLARPCGQATADAEPDYVPTARHHRRPYTGIIIASVATAALRATPAAWVGVALLTLGWYVKARLEERFLKEQLGPETYAAYAQRVPMLIPFLL